MVQLQPPIHPKGTQARVLLTSVFGPFAQDVGLADRELVAVGVDLV